MLTTTSETENLTDPTAWTPGESGKGYIAIRRKANGSHAVRLRVWSTSGGKPQVAEVMQADRIPLNHPAVDWAIITVTPGGSVNVRDPRDMSSAGRRRVAALAQLAATLDGRLASTARHPDASRSGIARPVVQS